MTLYSILNINNKMKCSPLFFGWVSNIHYLTIIFSIITTYYIITQSKGSVSLGRGMFWMIMVRTLVKLPNYICIALSEPKAWIVFLDITVSLASLILIEYYIEKENEKESNLDD